MLPAHRFSNDLHSYVAYQFVGKKKDPPFMHGGDSGCWIMNRYGQVEALEFATSSTTGHGYAIPMQDVCEDIENKLGACVLEPELD